MMITLFHSGGRLEGSREIVPRLRRQRDVREAREARFSRRFHSATDGGGGGRNG